MLSPGLEKSCSATNKGFVFVLWLLVPHVELRSLLVLVWLLQRYLHTGSFIAVVVEVVFIIYVLKLTWCPKKTSFFSNKNDSINNYSALYAVLIIVEFLFCVIFHHLPCFEAILYHRHYSHLLCHRTRSADSSLLLLYVWALTWTKPDSSDHLLEPECNIQ